MLKGINYYSFLNFLFIQFFPSITLETSIEDDVSPTTFNKVAAGSIIVATIVKIGSAVSGNPIIVIISVSDIVPPPTGIAVTKSVEISATNITFPVLTSALNRYTKNSMKHSRKFPAGVLCCFDIIIAIYYHGLKENAIEVNRRAAYNCLRCKGICRIKKLLVNI